VNDKSTVMDEVNALAARRSTLKAQKDYAEADELRKKIAELGYIVTDTHVGYNLVKL